MCTECGQIIYPKPRAYRQKMCPKCARINAIQNARKWALDHPEKRREVVLRHYALHRESRRESEQKYRNKNREKIRLTAKMKRLTCRSELLTKEAEYRSKHRDDFKKRGLKHYYKYRDRYLGQKRRKVSDLTDDYVRQLLTYDTSLSNKDFPPEIVEIKRQQIRLLRAIWNPKIHENNARSAPDAIRRD